LTAARKFIPAKTGFAPGERARMLALKGVGPAVVQRLEEIGFRALAEFRGADAGIVTRRVADHMGSTCWHNSPLARAAIRAIITLAESY
jgi:hypothetical protein